MNSRLENGVPGTQYRTRGANREHSPDSGLAPRPRGPTSQKTNGLQLAADGQRLTEEEIRIAAEGENRWTEQYGTCPHVLPLILWFGQDRRIESWHLTLVGSGRLISEKTGALSANNPESPRHWTPSLADRDSGGRALVVENEENRGPDLEIRVPIIHGLGRVAAIADNTILVHVDSVRGIAGHANQTRYACWIHDSPVDRRSPGSV